MHSLKSAIRNPHSAFLRLAAAFFILHSPFFITLSPPAHAASKSSKATGQPGGMGLINQMTRSNTRGNPNTADGPIANIDERWYLEFTPAYITTGALLDKFTGASAALGWRITQEDKLQIELGYYTSNNYTAPIAYTRNGAPGGNAAGVFTYTGMGGMNTVSPYPVLSQGYPIDLTGTKTAKATMIPLLISYSLCIQLDAPGRFELRLTPVTGLVLMNDTWRVAASGAYTAPAGTRIDTTTPDDAHSTITPDRATINRAETFNGKDANYAAFAMGGGFGLTWYFAPRWYVDAGYRFLWTSKAANKTNLATPTGTPWNGVLTWNGMNTHNYTLTLGWRF